MLRRRGKICIKLLKSFNKKYQQKRNNCLDKRKTKTNIIKIKYREQTTRNSTTFSGRQNTNVKNAPTKDEQRISG